VDAIMNSIWGGINVNGRMLWFMMKIGEIGKTKMVNIWVNCDGKGVSLWVVV